MGRWVLVGWAIFPSTHPPTHPHTQLVSASADGSLKLWDLMTTDEFPIAHWHEHQAEAASVDWNLVDKTTFVSASWDGSIKVGRVFHPPTHPSHPTRLSLIHPPTHLPSYGTPTILPPSLPH